MKSYSVEYSNKTFKIRISEPEPKLASLRNKINKKVKFYYKFLGKGEDGDDSDNSIDEDDEEVEKSQRFLLKIKSK